MAEVDQRLRYSQLPQIQRPVDPPSPPSVGMHVSDFGSIKNLSADGQSFKRVELSVHVEGRTAIVLRRLTTLISQCPMA